MSTIETHQRLLRAETGKFLRYMHTLADRSRLCGTVIPRSLIAFDDLKPWLGSISIVVWDPTLRDYKYKLFGTGLAEKAGRDHTGETMAVWGDASASMVGQFDEVFDRQSALISHFTERTFDGPFGRGPAVHRFEKVMIPVSYSDATMDAIFSFSVELASDQAFPVPPIRTCRCDSRDEGPCPYLG